MKIKEYSKAIFISLEFLCIVIGVISIYLFPSQIDTIAKNLSTSDNIVEWLVLIPFGCFLWLVANAKGLLFPDEKKSKLLLEWPDYWRLKIHFNISLFYSLLFAISGILVWILGLEINKSKGFTILFTSILGNIIAAASVYFAKITINEILTKYSK